MNIKRILQNEDSFSCEQDRDSWQTFVADLMTEVYYEEYLEWL